MTIEYLEDPFDKLGKVLVILIAESLVITQADRPVDIGLGLESSPSPSTLGAQACDRLPGFLARSYPHIFSNPC